MVTDKGCCCCSCGVWVGGALCTLLLRCTAIRLGWSLLHGTAAQLERCRRTAAPYQYRGAIAPYRTTRASPGTRRPNTRALLHPPSPAPFRPSAPGELARAVDDLAEGQAAVRRPEDALLPPLRALPAARRALGARARSGRRPSFLATARIGGAVALRVPVSRRRGCQGLRPSLRLYPMLGPGPNPRAEGTWPETIQGRGGGGAYCAHEGAKKATIGQRGNMVRRGGRTLVDPPKPRA